MVDSSNLVEYMRFPQHLRSGIRKYRWMTQLKYMSWLNVQLHKQLESKVGLLDISIRQITRKGRWRRREKYFITSKQETYQNKYDQQISNSELKYTKTGWQMTQVTKLNYWRERRMLPALNSQVSQET